MCFAVKHPPLAIGCGRKERYGGFRERNSLAIIEPLSLFPQTLKIPLLQWIMVHMNMVTRSCNGKSFHYEMTGRLNQARFLWGLFLIQNYLIVVLTIQKTHTHTKKKSSDIKLGMAVSS